MGAATGNIDTGRLHVFKSQKTVTNNFIIFTGARFLDFGNTTSISVQRQSDSVLNSDLW